MPEQANEIVIEDLVDFYRRWPELRNEALAISTDGHLSQNRKALLEWMILVIDRVGPADFAPELEGADV